MADKLHNLRPMLLIIIFPLLFCCATTQEKVDSYHARGMGYVLNGQYDQAISEFDKAIELNPKDAIVYNNRGGAYKSKGQYDQAISDYTKAMEIDPKVAPVALWNRGLAYYSKKEYDKSWDDINKAQDLGYKVPPKFLDDLRRASGRQN